MRKSKGKFFGFVILSVVLIFTGFQIGSIYGGEEDFPGSDGDPLITKSYLESRLSEKRSGSYQKISLSKGNLLILGEGSELIVYQGSAKVEGELLNVSKGILFEKGNSLVKYNVFLAPKENCGIIASDRMILFVSGSYQKKGS